MMKLIFNLDYQTTFGEQLVLNLLQADGVQKRHCMATNDGIRWTLELTPDAEQTQLTYYYSVQRGDNVVRTEWLVSPHLLEIVPKADRMTTNDRWTDIPEDSYLYSSAFTDCVARRTDDNKQQKPAQDADAQLILKVRAPQLRSGERLALVGAPVFLGNWDCQKALPATEHQLGEWTVALDADRLPFDFDCKFVILGNNTVIWEEGLNRHIVLPEQIAFSHQDTVAQKKKHPAETVVIELTVARFAVPAWKGAGTVVPVFSLRSEGSFGVGDFGDLKMMVDWCAQTGQRVLQILPINDTTITHTWQDSYPYNSISIYALHPQYCDLRQLPDLKDKARAAEFEALRQELNAMPQIDYERVNRTKREYLREVFAQEGAATTRRQDYKDFVERNADWLKPYAEFCCYRDLYGTADFSQWPAKKAKPQANELKFWQFVQYHLDRQMRLAHEHARNNKVILKGDIPIGISRDGVEAWVEPRYFNLNGQAGAPPDAFSVNGQNWGFPTYNWDAMLEDGCSWWVRRFRKMSQYFDAYRIDHVLGFFRIWEIPIDAVHGLLGQFSPSLGMTREEIESYGLHFDEERFTKPFIADWTLQRVFDERTAYVKEHFLQPLGDSLWQMKPEFDTQRKVEQWSKGKNEDNLRDGLYALISDVLFVRDRKDANKFHPRISVQNDFIYESLWDRDKDAFNRLYNDYFYRRNNQYWYHEAMKKLPKLTQATRMLVCAEDLGMVPDCVPWVMDELRILSLEIQSMPKDPTVRFGHLERNPYRSVCTISTHDMSTLRQWWDEDWDQTQAYFGGMLHHEGPAPHPLTGQLAREVVSAHLQSPSMLCLLSLQDWLSIDEQLRLPDADAERINIPANPRHYWRYRMHMTIEQLQAATGFNAEVTKLISRSGRA